MTLYTKALFTLKYIGRSFESAITDAVSVLMMLATAPLRDLARVRKKNISWKQRLAGILLFPFKVVVAILSIFVRILISPAELGVVLFRRKTRDILWTIPWIIGFLAMTSFLSLSWYNSTTRLTNLRKAAVQAFNSGDYESSEQKFAQLIQWSNPVEQADLLQWHMALLATDQKVKADEVLKELAPPTDTNPGYPPAHQMVAIAIVRQLKRPANPIVLKALKWHLDCGGESRSPEIHRCWAEYYIGVDEIDQALGHMKLAASIKPEYHVMVADAYRIKGLRGPQVEALEKAKNHYKTEVDKQPLVHKTRIMYARILKDLGELESAEQVLLAGVDLKDDPEIRSGCAGFYLMLFKEDTYSDFEKRFELLSKSLNHNENHLPTYEALIRLYRTQPDSPARQEITTSLMKAVQSDKPIALAHFALSNILWTENKFSEAEDHMEKAFRLDSKFAVVANNLAWLLAHSHNPDLDRAHQLAKMAVEQYPGQGRIRDTLATILMKQEKHEQALAEFQRALPTVAKRKEVHKKMATIYRKIGKNELAQQHENHAQSLAQ